MTWMTFPAWSDEGGKSSGKLGKVAVIIALHAGLFFLMKNGMLHRAVQQLPEVVNVTFVTPPPAPPAPPKTVEIAPKAPALVTPQLPVLPVVIENTITLPPPAPRSAEASPAPVVATPAAPAAPAPAQPSGPRIVSGVEYIRAPQPVYPSLSRRMGEQGVVTLRVLVNEQGRAEQASVQQSSGFSNLDEAGRQAAMRALFKPYLEDGKAIPVYVIVPINFRMS